MRFKVYSSILRYGAGVCSPKGSSVGAKIVGLAKQTVKQFSRSGRRSVSGPHADGGSKRNQERGLVREADAQPCCKADLRSGTDTPERDPFSRFAFTLPALVSAMSFGCKQPGPDVAAAVRSRLRIAPVHFAINQMGAWFIVLENETFYQETLQVAGWEKISLQADAAMLYLSGDLRR